MKFDTQTLSDEFLFTNNIWLEINQTENLSQPECFFVLSQMSFYPATHYCKHQWSVAGHLHYVNLPTVSIAFFIVKKIIDNPLCYVYFYNSWFHQPLRHHYIANIKSCFLNYFHQYLPWFGKYHRYDSFLLKIFWLELLSNSINL